MREFEYVGRREPLFGALSHDHTTVNMMSDFDHERPMQTDDIQSQTYSGNYFPTIFR
jgi:hypothetical protein